MGTVEEQYTHGYDSTEFVVFTICTLVSLLGGLGMSFSSYFV